MWSYHSVSLPKISFRNRHIAKNHIDGKKSPDSKNVPNRFIWRRYILAFPSLLQDSPHLNTLFFPKIIIQRWKKKGYRKRKWNLHKEDITNCTKNTHQIIIPIEGHTLKFPSFFRRHIYISCTSLEGIYPLMQTPPNRPTYLKESGPIASDFFQFSNFVRFWYQMKAHFFSHYPLWILQIKNVGLPIGRY